MKPVDITLSVGELAFVIGALNTVAETTGNKGTVKIYEDLPQKLNGHLYTALGAGLLDD